MPEASSSPLSVDVVRVFCDAQGEHGNPLGVVLEGAAIADPAERQEIAFELGFSETVFVDDAATGALRIFTPEHELPLAGHPLVGTAWLLADRGQAVHQLRPPAGTVPCGIDGGGAWIDALPKWAPPWVLRQLPTPDDVDAIDADAEPNDGLDYAWAWIDEPAGLVRARSFVKVHGIVEDEATGSAALRLCAQVGTPIEIRQGRGSRLQAAPLGEGRVRVQGRVVFDETITLDRWGRA